MDLFVDFFFVSTTRRARPLSVVSFDNVSFLVVSYTRLPSFLSCPLMVGRGSSAPPTRPHHVPSYPPRPSSPSFPSSCVLQQATTSSEARVQRMMNKDRLQRTATFSSDDFDKSGTYVKLAVSPILPSAALTHRRCDRDDYFWCRSSIPILVHSGALSTGLSS